jgi:hypothetical protein
MRIREADGLWAVAGLLILFSGCNGDSSTGNPERKDAQPDITTDTGPAVVCPANPDDLIADFTTDNGIATVDGRSGGFYVYGDNKGSFDPPKNGDEPYPPDSTTGNPGCSGPGSFRVKASGFAEWGAAAAVDFVPKSGEFKGTYDATKYSGVSFWAKAAAPLTGVLVSFPDIYTDGGADPAALAALDPTIIQACIYNSAATNNCSPYLVKFGDAQFPLYQDVQVNTEWKRFEVLFADTRQDKYNAGYKTAADVVDLKHLIGMAIQVNAKYDASGTPSANDFELWIDDVAFIR